MKFYNWKFDRLLKWLVLLPSVVAIFIFLAYVINETQDKGQAINLELVMLIFTMLMVVSTIALIFKYVYIRLYRVRIFTTTGKVKWCKNNLVSLHKNEKFGELKSLTEDSKAETIKLRGNYSPGSKLYGEVGGYRFNISPGGRKYNYYC